MTTTATTIDRLFEAIVKLQDAINRDLYQRKEGYTHAQTDFARVLAQAAHRGVRGDAGRPDSDPADKSYHPTVDWALKQFIQRFGHDDRMFY